MADDNTKNLGWNAEEYAALAGFDSDWRDSWWRQDYLQLLSTRLGFSDARTVLDVGCGAGHWGHRLSTLLGPEARITGVDHEAGFLDAARERAKQRPSTFDYRVATAEALPFEDDHFDLVTCQTVLMHVPDARAALREMVRVLRPGGLLLACEPNNLVNAITKRLAEPGMDDDALFRQARFDVTCLRGKAELGQGDSTVGEALPRLLLELGLEDQQIATNESTATMLPPYEPPSNQVAIDMLRVAISRGTSGIGDEATTRRLFEAGGGDPNAFEALWAEGLLHQRAALEALDAGTYAFSGGFVMYVASGRKPR
ncbi:MAG: class I SAM-dependent methyltransferase [Sandaracinaceae bacterium]